MGEIIKVSIGDNIRKYRKTKNLSQKQLAEMTGLATITIQGYEAGKYKPKTDTLERLAVALDCQPQDLRPRTVFRPTNIARTADIVPNTIAAHFDGEALTEEELEEIYRFIEFIKSKRKTTDSDQQ